MILLKRLKKYSSYKLQLIFELKLLIRYFITILFFKFRFICFFALFSKKPIYEFKEAKQFCKKFSRRYRTFKRFLTTARKKE